MNPKQLYEKMIDFKQYAVVLLAVGAFFYLGTIIPSEIKAASDIYISAGASTGFLVLSILFFFLSKQCQSKLTETEEGQEYLMKK
ncbi:YrhC family protein [Bacillus sp. T33-2]|uniref:YrhC family protein n=1 Tax=Bacillus sp. T33-2 TaxID=2054168 RepID=UPI0021557D21|nr:YrhC family protein [Bacillus sp. T33-2]